MAISRALDENWDIYFTNSKSAFVKDSDEVGQHVKTRLQFFLNEWFLDEEAGIPYFQEILKKGSDLSYIETRLKTEILNTQGVNSLYDFSLGLNRSTRKLSVSFSFSSIYDTETDDPTTVIINHG